MFVFLFILTNASAGSGRALSIGWKCLSVQEYNLSDYERCRSPYQREEQRDLYMSAAQRVQLLLKEWSCCGPEEIHKAQREAMWIPGLDCWSCLWHDRLFGFAIITYYMCGTLRRHSMGIKLKILVGRANR